MWQGAQLALMGVKLLDKLGRGRERVPHELGLLVLIRDFIFGAGDR